MTKQTIGLLIAVIVLPLACLAGGLRLMSEADESPEPPAAQTSTAGQETVASQPAVTVAPTASISLPAEVADLKTALVSINTGDYPKVSHIPLVYTATHGGLMWLEVVPESYIELKAAGIGVQLDRRLSLHPITKKDPLIEEPVVHPALAADEISGVKDFYLIQVRGQQKDEWLTTLEAYGADDYLQGFSSGVWRAWITPEEAEAIAELDFVRWLGPYHPEFRISPNLRGVREDEIQLGILLYDDGFIDISMKFIEGAGGQLAHQSNLNNPPSKIANFTSVPKSAITPTVHLKNVLWVESWVESYIE